MRYVVPAAVSTTVSWLMTRGGVVPRARFLSLYVLLPPLFAASASRGCRLRLLVVQLVLGPPLISTCNACVGIRLCGCISEMPVWAFAGATVFRQCQCGYACGCISAMPVWPCLRLHFGNACVGMLCGSIFRSNNEWEISLRKFQVEPTA